jgi:hypothetical protein
MKLNEFKKLVRPMIKEMVKEVMLEEGVLSNIVSEVASGLNQSSMVITEAKARSEPKIDPDLEQYKQDLKKQAMIDKVKSSQPRIFENTTPVAGEPKPGRALSGTDPDDAGVDISSILRMSGNNWGKLI